MVGLNFKQFSCHSLHDMFITDAKSDTNIVKYQSNIFTNSICMYVKNATFSQINGCSDFVEENHSALR